MKQSESYDRSIHRTGRLGSILAIAWMLGIPAVMCTVYHMFPSIPDLLLFGSGLLALYVLRRDFVGYLLACLVAGLLYEAGQVLPRLVSGAAGLPVLLRVAGLEYLWTAAFAIPVYGLYHLCCQKCGRIYHE